MSGTIATSGDVISANHGQEGAKPPEVCLVCGDRASGKHYGVISCDGCRGFFKRSIRKRQGSLYRCKDNNTCIVDLNRRNQCQACRFKKCMEVEMNPLAVQKERSPRPPKEQNYSPRSLDISLSPGFSRLQAGSPHFIYPHPFVAYPYEAKAIYHSYSLAQLASLPQFSPLADPFATLGHVTDTPTGRKRRAEAEAMFLSAKKSRKASERWHVQNDADSSDELDVTDTSDSKTEGRGRTSSRHLVTSAQNTSPPFGGSVSGDSPPTDLDLSPSLERTSFSSSVASPGHSPDLPRGQGAQAQPREATTKGVLHLAAPSQDLAVAKAATGSALTPEARASAASSEEVGSAPELPRQTSTPDLSKKPSAKQDQPRTVPAKTTPTTTITHEDLATQPPPSPDSASAARGRPPSPAPTRDKVSSTAASPHRVEERAASAEEQPQSTSGGVRSGWPDPPQSAFAAPMSEHGAVTKYLPISPVPSAPIVSSESRFPNAFLTPSSSSSSSSSSSVSSSSSRFPAALLPPASSALLYPSPGAPLQPGLSYQQAPPPLPPPPVHPSLLGATSSLLSVGAPPAVPRPLPAAPMALPPYASVPLHLVYPALDAGLAPPPHRLPAYDTAAALLHLHPPPPPSHPHPPPPLLPPAPPNGSSSTANAFFDASSYLSLYSSPVGRGAFTLNPALSLSGPIPLTTPFHGSAVSYGPAMALGAEDLQRIELGRLAVDILQEDIRWLASSTSFLSLSSRDRKLLLERGGCAMMLLGFLHRRRLNDLVQFLSQRSSEGEMSHVVAYLNFSARLQGLDRQEYSCLKLIALFEKDMHGLEDRATVGKVKDSALLSLRDYLEVSRVGGESPSIRHTNLLTHCNRLVSVDPHVLGSALFRQAPGDENFVCTMAAALL